MRAYAFAILASSCAVGVAQAADPALEGQVTVSFQRTPLGLAVAQIQKQSETNIVLAPGVNADAPVNLVVSDQGVGDVLDKLLAQQGLEKTAWAGAWVLHPKGAKLPKETAVEGKGSRALKLPISVDYRDANPAAVLQRVEARTKVGVGLPARVRISLRRSGAAVTLRLYSVASHHVLDHVALQTNLAWSLESGRVTFAAKAAEGEGVDLSMNEKGEADIDRLIVRLRSESVANREAAARELVLTGKQCLPKLAAALTAKGKDVRLDDEACLSALRVMADIRDASQYDAALSVFKDQDRPRAVQIAAADTLGAIGAAGAASELIEGLNDRVSLRRAEAARRALVMIGEPALKPLLARYRKELRSGKPQGVLYRALLIMGEVQSDDARKELEQAIATSGRNDFAVSIRHHAAIALGMTGDSKVIPTLIKALEAERDFLIAKYITRSLTWLTEERFPPDAVAWRAWWDGPGKRKYQSGETAEELLKRLAGGTIELPKNDKGTARLDETPEARLKRLTAQLGDSDPTKVRAAENDLVAMGEAALPTLRKLSAGEGKVAARAAKLINRIEASRQE